MTKPLLFSVATAFVSFSSIATAAVDWAQPPVVCVEDAVPALPEKACLDLTGVADPRKDFPANLPAAEIQYWKSKNRALSYCRGKEVLRREALKPGTFSSGVIEVSWMQVAGADHSDDKVNAVYEASRTNKIPVQVLTGALYQESMFVDLGIAEDGGNYSCGVGQVNVQEWCNWANGVPAARKTQIGWPANGVSCSLLPSTLIKPFYDIAKTKLNGLPEYRLEKSHFAGIGYDAVVGGFPAGDSSEQKLRFQAARSFIDNCSSSLNGVAAKANELASLYRMFIPAGMKARETYAAGDGFKRVCKQKGFEGQYPLHNGWLLAVGSYNAGPRAVDSLAYYNRWGVKDLADAKTFLNFSVVQMVEDLYWAGKYNAKDDRIHINTISSGADASWLWTKPCILQRHIARVVQHVTQPGAPTIVDTLEGSAGCAKSVFDPQTGELIKSGVPLKRQQSAGQKPLPPTLL